MALASVNRLFLVFDVNFRFAVIIARIMVNAMQKVNANATQVGQEIDVPTQNVEVIHYAILTVNVCTAIVCVSMDGKVNPVP